MTWANTAWGQVCASLHAFLLPEYPDLVLGIGVDEWLLHEGRVRLQFLGPGMVARSATNDISVPAEELAPTIKGARPPGKRALWDRVCPIRCRIAVPFMGSETLPDASPEYCEDLYERFLDAINTIAHLRKSGVETTEWFGGSAGRGGAAAIVAFTLRFTVYANELRAVKPTSTEVPAVETSNPGGATTGVMVPGGG